ncbi:MAG: response regulator [Chthonomonadales bacterium]|nr:response regulator [Chthonomonadales bacterium]
MSAREVAILIAEDDNDHAELIMRNLKRAGLLNRMIRLTDGQQTLDYLTGNTAEGPPSGALLLLLDLRMPKVDGFEVLKQVKESPRLRRMPVIVLTTTDDPEDVQRCHDLGCNSFITKPVMTDRFMEAVTTLGLFIKVVEVPHLRIYERAE